MSKEDAQTIIVLCAIFAILFGLFNVWKIMNVNVGNDSYQKTDFEENDGTSGIDQANKMNEIAVLIQDGSTTFLKKEYAYTAFFMVIFAIIINLTVEKQVGQFYTTGPFLIGAATSMLSGYIGMQIAVRANVRTAKEACGGLHGAFVVAFRGGVVLGFVLVGLALLNLVLLVIWYRGLFTRYGAHGHTWVEWAEMFECIAGYGLGGSTVALFGRVGGGIYTKAADVGADLVGKVIAGLDEDSIMNPGVIADNVGDNVGDIAGMGSDLFGSFAESTCACLVIAATSTQLMNSHAYLYPLLISAFGILVGFVTSFLATNIMDVDEAEKVEKTLKYQLVVSTVLMTPALYFAAVWTLPASFSFAGQPHAVRPLYAFTCTALGLWSGLCIGYLTEYYTSSTYAPVRKLANSSTSGSATSIIIGLSLGYRSTMIPVLSLSVTIYVSFMLANMFGISLAALGMLSTLTTALTIDGYGPISDNAGGIVEMSNASDVARERTDVLDAAGNTTAAIGKGFAIGSACLVALALFGAFVTRTKNTGVDILKPLEFSGLMIGAMLPYYFSAMTMEAVGDAAQEMIEEICRQFAESPGIKTGEVRPDYEKCIKISTEASIKKMIAPGLLVILSPLAMGFLFGAKGVSGMLAGAITSGIQIAISASNSGGAWDNAKKYIEGGKLVINGEIQKKGSEAHKSAVIGDTVGDPLKDTSGPSINILIKLMAITSLVFSGAFTNLGGILTPYITI